MMWIVLCFFLTISLVLLGLLFAWSPGQPQPFRDENGKPLPGSLSEKIRVEINGVAQSAGDPVGRCAERNKCANG